MFWPALFAIGIAQGLFLITLILFKKSANVLASRLMVGMLVPMVVSHIGYLAIRTDLINILPQLFGLPFGSVFLFGPLFYLYVRAVIDPDFRMTWLSALHFLPYAVQFIMNIPFLLMDKALWIDFVREFMAGQLQIGGYATVVLGLQNAHLLVYLIGTFRWVRSQNERESNYFVPVGVRMRWVKGLIFAFALFLLTVFLLYVFIVVRGKFDPLTNYVYTAITTAIIYYVAFVFVLKPQIISPDFNQRYRSYMPFEGENGKIYIEKLQSLFDERKIFIDPDLKLSTVADCLGLPQHQVSKLINDKFGKSFTELVNEYRVREFMQRVNDPAFRSHSLLGIALDVGFSSKSSFNSAFKKITGKTPSEVRFGG